MRKQKGKKEKYMFNPSPVMVFENKLEYALFKRKVEIAARMLGFSSVREMIKWFLIVTAESVPSIEKQLEGLRKEVAENIIRKASEKHQQEKH